MYSVLRIQSLPTVDAADTLELAFAGNSCVTRIDNSFAVTVAESPDLDVHLSHFGRLWDLYCTEFESLVASNVDLCFDIAVYENEYRNKVMKELWFSPTAIASLATCKVSVVVTVYGYFPETSAVGRTK